MSWKWLHWILYRSDCEPNDLQRSVLATMPRKVSSKHPTDTSRRLFCAALLSPIPAQGSISSISKHGCDSGGAQKHRKALSPFRVTSINVLFLLKRLPSEFGLNELWRREGTRKYHPDIYIKPTVKDTPGCEKLLALDYVYFIIGLLDWNPCAKKTINLRLSARDSKLA